jgi:F-type H+-transporting ATPase subunit b
MNELISTFHIDLKLMLAQLFNFALVFTALYFIAAKPLSKLMKDRKGEIETGLENAKEAQTSLLNANLKKEEIEKEAKNNAKEIVAKSQMDGKEIIKEAKDKATLEKEGIIKEAKMDAEKEKKLAEEAVRKETAELVKSGVKKMIEGYVADGKGDEIIKGMLS